MRKFAERLKELREEKELSKLALAKALQVADINIGRWERGEQEITSDNLIKIADFFDVSVDYLLGRTDD
ncbi:MAG: helix-turn-helix domain-containing protein [Firmicutes bacterium]|nr:helix-turn-helix domain-containing protein [Bacillota bacterium]